MPRDYVLAGIYVERFLSANPSILLTYSNVHRLVLASLVSAVKFSKIHIGNERFAAVGQITTKEMFDIEEAEFYSVDIDSHIVDSEAIDEYCTLLLREEEEAEPHSASPPPWHEEVESHSPSPPSHMTPTLGLPPRSAPSASQSAPSSASTTTTAPAPPPTDDYCFVCKFCGRLNSST
uniref:Uncharacterized protein n=1 Tax=Ananas comosus var. bracteatus TaxID=296719 RepID=A0A6V7PWI6_ANACO|nr:unnamed protein product [Ananas comosus var. bracteatus]